MNWRLLRQRVAEEELTPATLTRESISPLRAPRAQRRKGMSRTTRAASIIAACFLLVAEAQNAPPTAGTQVTPAQGSGRGAIQTASGGQGPGAAPDAGNPANADADLSPKPPVLPLSPTEQATRFWLPPGYRLEPVLADPIIDSPAQITFDGNGRMFVVELRGYEQTLDGIDANGATGRQ